MAVRLCLVSKDKNKICIKIERVMVQGLLCIGIFGESEVW